jgi:Leucine-rich repeat (LRR) protein
MDLDGLSSTYRGFVTWVAGMARRPLEEVWAQLVADGRTRLSPDGRHVVALDLSPVGGAIRLAVGPKRRLTLPLGGLEHVLELDLGGLDIDQLDLRVLPQLRELRARGNRLRELDLSGNPALERLDVGDNALLVLDLRANPALREVRCDGNALGALVLPETGSIERLSCARNQLMVLDLGEQPALRELSCHRNALVRLRIGRAPSLESVDASRNELESVEIGALPALRSLHLGRNRLDALDPRPWTALRELRCHGNYLDALDLRGLAALELVDARANQLVRVELGQHPRLEGLSLSDNRLEALDLAGAPSLRILRCSGNQLRELAVGPSLLQLDVADNPLRTLDPSPASDLVELDVGDTALATLDLRHNPRLVRFRGRGDRGRGPTVEATDAQRLRLRELRESAGLGSGAVDPAAMTAWELHDLAAAIRGRDAEERLLAVVQAPACDLGTAAMVYWTSAPHLYAEFAEAAEVPDYARAGFRLVRAIEDRVAAGGFPTAQIPYDPRDDRQTGVVRGVDRTAGAVGPIPEALLRGVPTGPAPAAPAEASGPPR